MVRSNVGFDQKLEIANGHPDLGDTFRGQGRLEFAVGHSQERPGYVET
jgi:hypothetical protein